MWSQLLISLVLLLVGGERGVGPEKKSLLDKEKKADEDTVLAGPYKTELKSYTYDGMNATSPTIDVWYPVGEADQKFPFISYAHGFSYGGPNTVIKYGQLLSAMAAFGYVIAAHESCNKGCLKGTWLLNDGPLGTMYKEQLKVIEWAKQQGTDGEAVFKSVNFDIGVGISGHSMGGQSTVYSSSSLGSGHGIKAAVMHNLYTYSYPAPIVPFLAFTGTEDLTAPSYMTKAVFDAKGANRIRGFVNKLNGDHLTPQEEWRELAAYTVAWFKLYLDEIRQDDTVDYEAMIFGTSNSSLCHGGFGAMSVCEVHDGSIASEAEKEMHSGAFRAWWSVLTVLACAVASETGASRGAAARG